MPNEQNSKLTQIDVSPQDTVGIGINYINKTFFYTKNHIFIGMKIFI